MVSSHGGGCDGMEGEGEGVDAVVAAVMVLWFVMYLKGLVDEFL